MDGDRLPRPEESAVFEPLLSVLADVGLAADLETGLDALFDVFALAVLLPAGLDADDPSPKSRDGLSDFSAGLDDDDPAPKSNEGLSDFSAGLDFDDPAPKSKDGLSVLSVDFDGC